jgi:hypothetical protein
VLGTNTFWDLPVGVPGWFSASSGSGLWGVQNGVRSLSAQRIRNFDGTQFALCYQTGCGLYQTVDLSAYAGSTCTLSFLAAKLNPANFYMAVAYGPQRLANISLPSAYPALALSPFP